VYEINQHLRAIKICSDKARLEGNNVLLASVATPFTVNFRAPFGQNARGPFTALSFLENSPLLQRNDVLQLTL